MSQTFAEVLLTIPAAMCTGFVIFVAGVIQAIMNDQDEADFKRFLVMLKNKALRSPFAIGISSVTFAGMIPYFIVYRFGNTWFTAGLAMWVIASTVSKITVLPIYARVESLDSSETFQLAEERRKLHRANILRATLSALSVLLMTAGLK